MTVEQMPLLRDAERADQPRKRQRDTARQVYRDIIDQARVRKWQGKETREDQVLRCLERYFDDTQFSPTALELLDWMRRRGEKVFDINSLRPRLTELVERRLIEPAQKRKCFVSGKTVHTWRIREAGSQEPR